MNIRLVNFYSNVILALFWFVSAYAQTIPLVNKIQTVKDDKAYYSIAINYPGITDRTIKNRVTFNQAIQRFIQRQITDFNKHRTPSKALKNISKNLTPPELNAKSNQLLIDYDLFNQDNSLISVRFAIETYFYMQAHPAHIYQVINYDLNRGKVINFPNLFLNQTRALKAIAQYCQTTLLQKFDKEIKQSKDTFLAKTIKSGTAPRRENYLNWNISKQGLVITFPPYQVAYYAAGTQEVVVPFSIIKPYLRSRFLRYFVSPTRF